MRPYLISGDTPDRLLRCLFPSPMRKAFHFPLLYLAIRKSNNQALCRCPLLLHPVQPGILFEDDPLALKLRGVYMGGEQLLFAAVLVISYFMYAYYHQE